MHDPATLPGPIDGLTPEMATGARIALATIATWARQIGNNAHAALPDRTISLADARRDQALLAQALARALMRRVDAPRCPPDCSPECPPMGTTVPPA